MKKVLGSIMIIMLSIGVILGLCSCRLEESYKEFSIKNITSVSVSFSGVLIDLYDYFEERL